MGWADFWKWFWRVLGVAALLFMIFITALFWTAWRASPFKAAADGKPLESGIDMIAIQIDILSLIIAVMGIGLAVMSIIGYQSIKAGAEAAAIKTASAKADEIATRAVALHMQNIPGTDGVTQPSIEPDDVLELTEEEKGE